MAQDERHTTAAEDRVPWNQLIAFGLGGLIPIALFNIVLQLVPLLGNISLGLSAVWLGAILVVPRLWEALSDPVVGHLSDNTRTRWGRRRPYILVGGIVVAVSFVAMWWVPREEALRNYVASDAAIMWSQLAYILGALLVFFTACAVFEIPHGALGLEMSTDYHERTRLFSAKSFLGNLFAMGTPWLIFFASLERFSGPGGNLVDGMRYVSMIIAAVLIPLAIWWFMSLREPGFEIVREQKKSDFWHDMRATIGNKTFLLLTTIVFALAMGFNFVGNFANYITIFYLYGGDVRAASPLLGITGTVWAVTALVAVVPLNWLGRRLGKSRTLLVAILLMCAAQLSKIVCYQPGTLFELQLPAWLATEHVHAFPIQGPYLILIPTMLLSAGMLMFFTLGSSMVGDVCDEDELKTGTRSDGTYYSVFWWFIKMGTAGASFVMGALLVYTSFDERQNVLMDAVAGNVAIVKAEAEAWATQENASAEQVSKFSAQAEKLWESVNKLQIHFSERQTQHPEQDEHITALVGHANNMLGRANSLRSVSNDARRETLLDAATDLLQQSVFLRQQSPVTLFRLRLVEIGLPVILSIVSIILTLRYPLTEARCYEIKELLKQRREAGTAQ